MNQLWINLPAYAGDYSGVCSAFFDLGGLCVIHDASGCMGNYTGYDEPRWYGSSSRVFSSGLRELDAVLGRDDRLIGDILKAGELLKPTLYAVVGSPVPMVVGTDTEGIAFEIERRTSRPAFGFDTNGIGTYNQGASEAMYRLVKRFAKSGLSKRARGVNIVGTTPLDLGATGNAEGLEELLLSRGFQICARMMMGCSLPQLERASEASVNLVVTQSGMRAARYMEREFGIPYVAGIPVGSGDELMELLQETEADRLSRVLRDASREGEILIVGEQLFSNSLRRALLKKNKDLKVSVGVLTGLDSSIAGEGDMDLAGEAELTELIYSGRFSVLVGDPLLGDIFAGDEVIRLIPIPHAALSSKLYWDEIPLYCGEAMEKIIDSIIEGVNA